MSTLGFIEEASEKVPLENTVSMMTLGAVALASGAAAVLSINKDANISGMNAVISLSFTAAFLKSLHDNTNGL